MSKTRRIAWLLAANLTVIPILCIPSFGFIEYMNIHGTETFVVTAWLLAVLFAASLWRKVAGAKAYLAYVITLVSALVPVAVGWGAALHPLYWSAESGFREIWLWVENSLILGGFFTGAYWLPASIVNCLVLRRGAA